MNRTSTSYNNNEYESVSILKAERYLDNSLSNGDESMEVNSNNSVGATQAFLIHRHGARYPIREPSHNIAWPKERSFWRNHLGRLTPMGVIQMSRLGDFFNRRYPWLNQSNVKIYSTARSRALESAWSFTLGLMPNSSIRFNSIKVNPCQNDSIDSSDNQNQYSNNDDSANNDTICLINYYRSKNDLIFGQEDSSRAYKININQSPLLQEYVKRDDIQRLVDRLSGNGHLRIRRDSITTIAKLKEIYSQIQIDHQLQIPKTRSLVSHYNLTDSELELINQVGCEVMHRRLIPSTDSVNNQLYNKDQGIGLLKSIYDKLINWNKTNEFNIYSCHDTNMIALMSIFGLKIVPPDFCGYILMERMIYNGDNIIAIYYCPTPFDTSNEVAAKVWPDIDQRTDFLDWNNLSEGSFYTNDLLTLIKVSLERWSQATS